jgi:hydrogenase small subunit
MKTLFWLQTGACGGDSLAILSADSPSLEQLFSDHGIELLWHPSLSHAPMSRHDALLEAIVQGEQTLDLLCVEGKSLLPVICAYLL